MFLVLAIRNYVINAVLGTQPIRHLPPTFEKKSNKKYIITKCNIKRTAVSSSTNVMTRIKSDWFVSFLAYQTGVSVSFSHAGNFI
jgi:hypothetical protein